MKLPFELLNPTTQYELKEMLCKEIITMKLSAATETNNKLRKHKLADVQYLEQLLADMEKGAGPTS